MRYIPEAKGSAWGDCTVRHILDMTVDLDFEESYLNPDGDYARYREATGWNPPIPRDHPLDQNSFLLSLRRGPGEHGKSFAYMSPNSDFLGWLLERAGGKPLVELLSDHIRRPMGARDAAYVTLDRLGMARGAGGICATAHDLALLGATMRDGGKAGGRQVIPAGWVADIRTGGDRDPWINGDPAYYELLPACGARATARTAPDERTRETGHMSHYQRALVSGFSRLIGAGPAFENWPSGASFDRLRKRVFLLNLNTYASSLSVADVG